MTQKQTLFWMMVTALVFAFVWVFQSVLLPFILGFAIAYLLNPVVNKLGRAGVSRFVVTILILCLFFVSIIAFLALVTPIIMRQAMDLLDNLPGYSDRFIAFVSPYAAHVSEIMGQGEEVDVRALLQEHMGTATNMGKAVINALITGIGAGGQAITSTLSLLIITPLVAFFCIKDWPAITAWVEDLFPRPYKKTIMNLLAEIDKKLSGFVRGQFLLAFFLGLFYAIALTIAELQYSIVVGFVVGIMSIIPMVGSIVGLLIGIILAWLQTGDFGFVALIGGIFLLGQFLEGNVVAPKLIGQSVGMHPIWIFFALLAGGSLFGILGMLLAVPVAAIAGVLLTFGIFHYKKSSLYKGAIKRKARSRKKGK